MAKEAQGRTERGGNGLQARLGQVAEVAVVEVRALPGRGKTILDPARNHQCIEITRVALRLGTSEPGRGTLWYGCPPMTTREI